MAARAEKTDPKLWDQVKQRVTRGSKGGDPGEWSARKAQLAVQEYKKAGGGYRGGKSADNHLTQWTKEEWGTRSGKKSGTTGERYLPKKARETLSKEEYDRTTAKKRADTKKGKQFSAQPKDVARKAASTRKTGTAAKAAPKRATPKRAAPKRATAARKAPAKRADTTRQAAPKRAAAKPAPRKTPARKAPARKAPARKTTTGRAPARRSTKAKA